jgi:hypothetical protein
MLRITSVAMTKRNCRKYFSHIPDQIEHFLPATQTGRCYAARRMCFSCFTSDSQRLKVTAQSLVEGQTMTDLYPLVILGIGIAAIVGMITILPMA